jgi:hypothetical protein
MMQICDGSHKWTALNFVQILKKSAMETLTIIKQAFGEENMSCVQKDQTHWDRKSSSSFCLQAYNCESSLPHLVGHCTLTCKRNGPKTFCPFSLIQLTVQDADIFYVVVYNFFTCLLCFVVSVFFLMLLITSFEKVGRLSHVFNCNTLLWIVVNVDKGRVCDMSETVPTKLQEVCYAIFVVIACLTEQVCLHDSEQSHLWLYKVWFGSVTILDDQLFSIWSWFI